MTNIGKWLTILVTATIIVALITHPAGSAGDMAVGGAVLDKTLSITSGQGISSGTKGAVSYNGSGVYFS